MHQQRSNLFGLFRQDAGRQSVDLMATFRLGFRFVDCGIGGGIDNYPGSNVANPFPNGVPVREINFGVIDGYNSAGRRERAAQFPANLADLSNEENMRQ